VYPARLRLPAGFVLQCIWQGHMTPHAVVWVARAASETVSIDRRADINRVLLRFSA